MKAYVVETDALRHNLSVLREKAGGKTLWAVVKGNGYGLGTGELSRFLAENGVDHFAVTDISEVRTIRKAGLDRAEILMMEGSSNQSELRELLELGAILSVGSPNSIAASAEASKALGKTARVHLKIDTGMGRFGFLPENAGEAAKLLKESGLAVEGMYTHFYDATDPSRTEAQFGAFQAAVAAVKAEGVNPGMVHCCNSSAFWLYPKMHCDGVRLGSAILGRVAFSKPTGLKRVGWCEAELEEIRTLPAGHSVGYGAGWVAKSDTRIAVLGVGYSHGFGVERGFDLWRLEDCLRGVARYVKAFLKKKALYVTVNGKSCRVLGHVGMINMVIDVSGCECKVGDFARVEINPLLVKDLPVSFR